MGRRKKLPVFGKYPSNGEYYIECQRSGKKIRRKDAKRTWDNLLVQPQDWEPRQPLDFPPQVRPERRIIDVRPEHTDEFFTCSYYVEEDGTIIYSCVPRNLPLATQGQITAVVPTVTSTTATVSDEATGDTAVVTVSASDPNGLPLTYSIISGDTNDNFRINETTGVITLIQISPLVEDDVVTLTVQATNTLDLSGTGTVTITVTGIFDPTAFGDTIVWFDTQAQNSVVKDENNRVSQWTDQTANTYSLVQGTADNEPLEITDVTNELEAIQFSDADNNLAYYLQIEQQANLQFINNDDSTIIMVGKFYDYDSFGGVSARSIFGNSANTGQPGLAVSVNNFNSGQRDLLVVYRNQTNVILTSSTTFTQFENRNFILVLRFNTTTGLTALVTADAAVADLDITQAISNAPDGQNPVTDFYMGVNSANLIANNNNFRGQIQAFYMWNTYLTNENVTSAVASLKTQWGIA